MPELQDPNIDWDLLPDCVATYLERDVRELVSVKNEAKFYSFMVVCSRTGQLRMPLILQTPSTWIADGQSLSVLQASNIVRVIEPFWPNIDKRLTKTEDFFHGYRSRMSSNQMDDT